MKGKKDKKKSGKLKNGKKDNSQYQDSILDLLSAKRIQWLSSQYPSYAQHHKGQQTVLSAS
jgi:hypothetical protein